MRVEDELLAEVCLGDLVDRQPRRVRQVVKVDDQDGAELARRDRRVLLDVPDQILFLRPAGRGAFYRFGEDTFEMYLRYR